MAQTREGAIKTVAKKAGISARSFKLRLARGQKWCYKCRTFRVHKWVCRDACRYDGLSSVCKLCGREIRKQRYVPKPGPRKYGPDPKPGRDGDKFQARQRINVLVRTKRLPHPNSLPCHDCWHVWLEGERRHEYDHHLGYAAENHYKVQSTCTICHYQRGLKRGEYTKRAKNSKGIFVSSKSKRKEVRCGRDH